ncbi:MAG: hypothetical protein ACYCY2_05210 [Acidithiobacillus ferriphilus]
MNPKEFAAMFAKTMHAMKTKKPLDPQLQKALDEELANEFDRFIPDWEQPGEIDKVPTAQQIIFGPTEASSGAGAARMVEQYSSFADQNGITALYAEFSRRMAPMRADMDAVKSEIATIKNSVFSLVKASEDAAAAVTAPAAKAKDDDEDEDEKTRMVEKARKTMRKARVLIVKAEDAEGGDSEEDGEEDEISEDMEKAARLLKGVKEDLTKAEEARKDDEDEDEEIEKARAMRKSLVKRLSAVKKSRAPAVVKTKEEEEAEEEAKKAAEAAAKAKDNDKGNQDASQNPANGNQDDAAAKSSEVSLLTKSVSELMDFLMTSASGARINPAPVFQKAQQDKVASIELAIDEAADNMEISESEAVDAKGIVARLEMIKSGAVDRKSVLDMVAKATPKVQALFSRVA